MGDAGAPAPAFEPVLEALRTEASRDPARTFIAFLGDNVYPEGLPDSNAPGRTEAERRLDAQIAVLRDTGARGVFVPGNHDWDGMGDDGWEAVVRQGRYIAARGVPHAVMLPGGGCPGPALLDVGTTLRLVILDTQWWLQGGAKPLHPTSQCPADSMSEVMDSLRQALRGALPRHVAVLAHHPAASGGPHGGYFPWDQHIFPLRQLKGWLWVPLPVIGSAYPLARKLGISVQDISSAAYGRMRDSLVAVLDEYPPLIFGAGHDHGLQVLAESGVHLLISGAGTFGHLSPIAWRDNTRFAASASGYMRIDGKASGGVRLGVLVVDRYGVASEVFSMWLEGGNGRNQ